ncbi:MAG: hypothetical protein PHP02_00855 [Eubacteriales bacterium]|nr:hypothetical protein [Eubacteriales bacterium]
MKKALSLLLSALMLLAALPALAQEYTLDEKLIKQVQDGSGLRAAITFEKTGGALSLLDAAANAALNVLAQGSVLEIRYLSGVGTLKGKEDLEITLSRGTQPLADLRYLKDTQLEALTSTLLSGVGYADVRDGGVLLALMTGQDVVWPPVEGVLIKLNTAESTWQAAAGRKLDAYTAKMSLWLQGYTQTSTQRDEANNLLTRIDISIPPEPLKSQIKQLMLDVYNDAELLALLAQELDGRQAAAYLQPGMMNSFFTSLDQLKLSGNVESSRVFDREARLVESRLALPLGGARGITRLTHEYSLDADAAETNTWRLDMRPENEENTTGAVHLLTYAGGSLADAPESQAYTGSYSFTPEAGQAGFTVDEGQTPAVALAYNFNLFISPGEEVMDPATRRSIREDEITLVLTPQGEDAPAAQSFQLKMRLESGERTNSATSFKGTLTWQDQETEGLLTAAINGTSAPPWQIPDVALTGLTRVDTMTQTQLDALGEQVQQTLESALTQLLLRLTAPLPTAAP